MATQPPTTSEISANIIAQLEASLSQTIPLFPKAFNRVLAKVFSGVFVILYKYIGFMGLQQFVRTAVYADTEINGVTVNPLLFLGRLIGVGDLAAATNAELTIQITVTNQTGSLPVNSQLLGSSNGVTYVTLSAVALSAATVTVDARAVADQSDGGGAGVIGNLDVGDTTVSFANPIPNVARGTEVTAQVVTGADAEEVSAYRQRILDRFQKRPQGGAYSDYETWGEEPAGIINIYPYRASTPGQVDVYVEATPASSGDPDGIPTTAQLEEVLAAITLNDAGLASRMPVGALANTFPISRLTFDMTVVGLDVDNDVEVKADLEQAVTEYLLSRAPYIVGLSPLPRVDRVTVSAVGGTVEDIVSAAGGVFTEILLEQTGSPFGQYSLGLGEKAKLGTTNYL